MSCLLTNILKYILCCPGLLVGSAVDGHRTYYANGWLHQDLQCPHPQQQPQTAPTKATARYAEKETTAASQSTASGPARTPSAKRELSNGTDETLRHWSALCLGSLVPTMGALHSKELPLPHIAKFKELATGSISLDKA